MSIKLHLNPSTGNLAFTQSGNLQAIDSTILPGNDCACWGDESPYGPLPTPSQMTLTIEGVEKGDLWVSGDGEPMNGVFDITQSSSPSLPCFFGKSPSPGLSIPLTLPGLVSATNTEGSTYFVQSFSIIDACWVQIDNVQSDPETEKFVGGTMTLSGFQL